MTPLESKHFPSLSDALDWVIETALARLPGQPDEEVGVLLLGELEKWNSSLEPERISAENLELLRDGILGLARARRLQGAEDGH